jgi:diguanylate cyclase (GGDEF)-like protein
LRTDDSVGRYGGEEFCLLLPHSEKARAAQMAERLRSKVKTHNFNGIQVTVSIGVADMQSEAPSGTEVLDRADKALYVAKTGGRNRVIQYGDQDVQAA